MKNYRMRLDISSVFNRIKHLTLHAYKCPFPTVFIQANDPDEACRLAFDELITKILHQDPTLQMRLICREIKQYCRIDKITEL